MIGYVEDDAAKVIELTVDGRIEQEAFRELVPRIEAFIEKHGKIRILEVIRKFEGFDPSVLLEDITFSFRHMRDFTHAAIVTDTGWVQMFTRALGPVIPAEVKVFDMKDIEAARAWLKTAA